MTSLRAVGVLAVAMTIAASCSDPSTPDPFEEAPALSMAEGATPSLNLYGLGGLARAVPRSACGAEPYRQFDFWLGAWDVFNPAGTQVGTSSITNELDGCVIAESWTDVSGQRGRSINTYDAETNQWHQTWVSANTLGHLRLAGGIVDGEMVMDGVRESVFGFPFFNNGVWTALSADRVRQFLQLRIPAIGVQSSFTGIYERVDEITPAAEQVRQDCTPGGISAETRRGDFLVGVWQVVTSDGKAVGESTVRTDLSECLFEERFETPKGYEAVAFTYWDRVVGSWYRTYIDSEGERLELAGGFDEDRLVLVGTDAAPNGSLDVRVTLAPRTGGGVDQIIETSRDGGVTWEQGPQLAFIS